MLSLINWFLFGLVTQGEKTMFMVAGNYLIEIPDQGFVQVKDSELLFKT